MQHSPRVLRASAVATALAGLIALATPVTGGLVAGEGASIGMPVEASPFTGAAPPAASGDDASRQVRPRAPRPEREPRRHVAPEVIVDVPDGGLVARRNPRSSAAVIGRVVDRSRYYGVPTVAWVEEVTDDGRWGRVELPYVWPRQDGWVRIDQLRTDVTQVRVIVDVSARRLTLRVRGEVRFRASVATGRSSSPTPPGEYFVTDRVPFAPGSAYGSFAFGISGIQPRLPVGWSGGDQLAIHGTNAPSTIGTPASAGCLRASEATLAKLKPLLQLGTPVVIVP